jgi:hypothetical protein
MAIHSFSYGERVMFLGLKELLKYENGCSSYIRTAPKPTSLASVSITKKVCDASLEQPA